MDEKTLQTLEFDKVLARLASYSAFSASIELAHALRPVRDVETARRLMHETSEAQHLLNARPETTIGGARDVRPQVEAAARDALLNPSDFLDIKATMISARTLGRSLASAAATAPNLAAIAETFPPPLGLVAAISQTLSERGDVLDSASAKLGAVRRELRISHDRLLDRLQRMVNDSKVNQYLQENLVTQRDGRYVLPLRSEFKGWIKAIVHDQSASGATLFIEPLAVVELNNRYRELQLEERDEIRRILAELSRLMGDHARAITQTVETLAALDLIFAKAKYAEVLRGSAPKLTSFKKRRVVDSADSLNQRISESKSQHPGSVLRLWQARHPLLDPQTVVPIDVVLDPETFILVITGPNTGGKTVSLKTAGLLVLMAQAGLHIPAHPDSELTIFEKVYADIGDEQSIEQSLSTFSGHIMTIIRILKTADPRTLVILDELGAGTDPQEGAALAQSILAHLVRRSVTTLVATHYPALKAYAHAVPGVVNASVEFDLETLSPTYHLTIGLPGRSNALAIARRLGLPEAIVEAAREEVDPTDLKAEDLLDEIHRQRDQAREAREAAEQVRRDAEAVRAELAGRLEKIEDERRGVLQQAQVDAAEELSEIQEELRTVRLALAHARQPLEVLATIEEQVEELEAEVAAPVERLAPASLPSANPRTVERRAIRLGDKVRLRSLGTQGLVGALGESHAEVQVGNLRVRARLTELELVGGSGPAVSAAGQVTQPADKTPLAASQESPERLASHLAASPGIELDLRGRRVDEALDTLEGYLDSAYLANLPYVRVIHGKGTGRLREAVREALQGHPHVKSFEGGKRMRGAKGSLSQS